MSRVQLSINISDFDAAVAFYSGGWAVIEEQVYVTPTLVRHDPRSSHVFDDQIRALPQIIAADNVADETDYLLPIVVARDVADLQEVLVALVALATRGRQRLGHLPAAGPVSAVFAAAR